MAGRIPMFSKESLGSPNPIGGWFDRAAIIAPRRGCLKVLPVADCRATKQAVRSLTTLSRLHLFTDLDS